MSARSADEQAARRSKRDAERDQERIERTIEGLPVRGRAAAAETAREQAVYNAVAAAGVDINSQQVSRRWRLWPSPYDLQEAERGHRGRTRCVRR